MVEFREATGALVGETQATVAAGPQPVPFRLDVPRGKAGVVQAAVVAEGRPAWLSDTVDVEEGDADTGVGTLLLKPYAPVGGAHTFRCGDQAIEVVFAEGRALVRAGADILDLPQVRSGSGARYAAEGEPETSFWNKGDKATFTLKGEVLPECEVVLPAAAPGPDLAGREWTVQGVGLLGFAAGVRQTMVFDAGGHLTGTAGCNTYSATYRQEGSALTIGPIASTRRSCEPEVMDEERRFLDALAGVSRVQVGRTGGLVLQTLTGASIRAGR